MGPGKVLDFFVSKRVGTLLVANYLDSTALFARCTVLAMTTELEAFTGATSRWVRM